MKTTRGVDEGSQERHERKLLFWEDEVMRNGKILAMRSRKGSFLKSV